MRNDPRTEPVTVRVLFTGVMLACLNERKHYEVGMIRCPKHEPKITVYKDGSQILCITQDPKDKVCLQWPKGHDLTFKVINPDSDEVSPHPKTDQDTDFKRVIDLEGFLLHRDGVKVHKSKLSGRRLAVTAGKLYTHELSQVAFDLFTWTKDNDTGTFQIPIGQIARSVGLNIQCQKKAGSAIEIIDIQTKSTIYSLPASDGQSYEIHVENDCRKDRGNRPEAGTDFRFFYQQGVVASSDGLKFDLGIARAKRSPDACENTFLSQTNELGNKPPDF